MRPEATAENIGPLNLAMRLRPHDALAKFVRRVDDDFGLRPHLRDPLRLRPALPIQSAVALPLSALIVPRLPFSSRRRVREASVGLVARRGFSRSWALTSKAASRARASSRLRGWLENLCAKMTTTPSWVVREPASFISRM